MGKITVKHYLNTNLKPYIIGNDRYYKLYFLLRYQNKNTKIRSLVTEDEYTEDEFAKIIADESSIVNKRISNEIAFIERVISAIEHSKIPFDIKIFNDFWKIATYPIIRKFSERITWLLDVRYKDRPDQFQQLNIDTYNSILLALKNIVADNSNYVSDEIYLAQLYDKRFVSSLNKSLQKNKAHIIWEYSSKTEDNIIKTIYNPTTRTVTDILFENLIEAHFYMEFPDSVGSGTDRVNYYKNIIRSFEAV